MELVTTHVHTNYCGHAEGSVEEMVAAAERAGVSTVAITEHFVLSEAFDPIKRIGMDPGRVDSYIEDVKRARIAHPGIEVLCGTELDWLGDLEDRDLASWRLDRFDVVLGSVHYLDGWGIDDKAKTGHWEEVGVDELWRRYFEVWCEAAASKAPFTVMSHPDLIKKYGHVPSFDPTPLYEAAAEAAAVGGRMVEVNTSGASYACEEMFPAPELLRLFRKAGVPCTVGTDAHSPEHIARGIEEAYRLMAEAGYDRVTVPGPGGSRREIAIR